jgi:hypothetical protein
MVLPSANESPALGHGARELALLVELPRDALVGHDLPEHVVDPAGPSAREVGHGRGVGPGDGPRRGRASDEEHGDDEAHEPPLPAALAPATARGAVGPVGLDQRCGVVDDLGRGLHRRRLGEEGEVDLLELAQGRHLDGTRQRQRLRPVEAAGHGQQRPPDLVGPGAL